MNSNLKIGLELIFVSIKKFILILNSGKRDSYNLLDLCFLITVFCFKNEVESGF